MTKSKFPKSRVGKLAVPENKGKLSFEVKIDGKVITSIFANKASEVPSLLRGIANFHKKNLSCRTCWEVKNLETKRIQFWEYEGNCFYKINAEKGSSV
jgi:hypothetical protein